MQIIKTDNYTLDFSLYDFYKENGGNHAKLKDRFYKALDNLDEDNRNTMNFALAKIANGGIGASVSIETVIMDSRTALWFSSKLDDNLRLKVIDKVNSLTAPQLPNNTDKLLEGLLEQGKQTQQLLAFMVQSQSQNNQETELDRQKKRLEIDKLQLEKISMVADMSTKYKLEQLGDLSDIPSELSDSMKSLAGAVVKEVRPAINGVSPTSALNAFGEAVRVKDFYKAMNDSGLTSYHEETRYLGGVNITHEIINEGRYYGYNQHASSIKKYPVQCKFYSDRFPELLVLLRRNGFLV